MLKFAKNTPIRDKKLYQSYREKHYLCERCSSMGGETHHIKYRSQGGSDTHDNLIFLCNPCHRWAHGVNSREARLELQEIKRKGK